jgi:hypothetical protein
MFYSFNHSLVQIRRIKISNEQAGLERHLFICGKPANNITWLFRDNYSKGILLSKKYEYEDEYDHEGSCG